MTKKELLKEISKKANIPVGTVDDVLASFAEVTIEAMKKGDKVRLPLFGVFATRLRKERKSYLHNKVYVIPEKQVPSFAFSDKVKEQF